MILSNACPISPCECVSIPAGHWLSRAAWKELGVPVVYPGLESFAQHRLATDLINKGYGYGGMFTIDCGTRDRADDLLDELQNKEDFGYIAVSLGYFDTLMSCSGASTSSEISREDQQKMGLSPGLVRLSIGYNGQPGESDRSNGNGRSGLLAWLRSKGFWNPGLKRKDRGMTRT